MSKYIAVIAVMLAIAFVFTSCSKPKPDFVDDSITNIFPKEESESPTAAEKKSEIIGDFLYPENPSRELQNALYSDINEHGFPMEIGDVEKVEFDNREYYQIKIDFTGGNENVCIISFFDNSTI